MLSNAIKNWDRDTADRVDHYIANSHYIAETNQVCLRSGVGRCVSAESTQNFYHRDASVVRKDFYLIVSAASPYKRLDHAIEACRILGRKLKIVGRGQQLAQLRRQAADLPGVELLGLSDRRTDSEAVSKLSRTAFSSRRRLRHCSG